MNSLPAWFQWAKGELGVRETPGPKSTPRVMEYRKIAELPFGGEDGAVPWCAIFVNAALDVAGCGGSKSAMARSFLRWGIDLGGPARGAIVVLSSSRGPTSGHVGFYDGETPTHVRLLGGNQGDAVSRSLFPKSKVLGYRWPVGEPLPQVGPQFLSMAPPARPVRDG